MDKREFSIKVEQMEKQAERGDYETAMKIADKIDWRRVPNVIQLTRVAEIYEKNGEYREAQEILLLALERAPMARGILAHLIELVLMEHDSAAAEKYYHEFLELAPEDSRQYVLRYSILKEKGAAATQKIPPLERYISEELDEERMYELAELYHEAGRHAECVELCDRIAVLFGMGQWVEKALLLKLEGEGQPLTEYQQNLLDNREATEEAAEFRTETGKDEASAARDEIDAEIEAHLKQLETERSEMLRDARQNEAAAAVVRAERARAALETETAPSRTVGAVARTEAPELPEERERASEAVKEATEEEAGEIAGEVSEKAAREEAVKPLEAAGEDTAEQPADVEAVESEKNVKIPETAEAEDITRVLPDVRKALEKKAAEENMGETRILPRLKNAELEQKADEMRGRAAEEAVKAADATQTQPEIQSEAAEETRAVEQAKNPGSFNCLIEGKTAGEGLNAAISRLKEIHTATGIRNTAAKIRAGRLNVRGVQNSAEKIAGKDLIVEEAGDLSPGSITELLELIAADEGKRTILLVDNPLQLSRLVERYPMLEAAFCGGQDAKAAAEIGGSDQASDAGTETRAEASEKTQRTELSRSGEAAESRRQSAAERAYEEEELDIDAFAHYAGDYAKKIDCVITGKSMLALYERIEIMQEDGVRLSRKNAEALIEEVADRAEKPPLLKRIGGMFSRKYDKEGMLILKEDDFIS